MYKATQVGPGPSEMVGTQGKRQRILAPTMPTLLSARQAAHVVTHVIKSGHHGTLRIYIWKRKKGSNLASDGYHGKTPQSINTVTTDRAPSCLLSLFILRGR